MRGGVLVCVVMASAGSVSAALPIDDGPDGMTCQFYAKAAHVPWQRKGGDWIDARNEMHGAAEYAVQRIPVSQGKERFAWDVTTLAKQWTKGVSPPGAVVLRAGKPGGTVNFASRENPDAESRPRLIIEWQDGQTTRVEATADTYFSCPTNRSLGTAPIFQVGGQNNALLAFPYRQRAGKEIARASLELTSDKQYAGGTEVAVFRPYFPWAELAPPEQGIAAHYVGDAGLEGQEDVLYVDRFESSSPLLPSGAGEGHAEIVSIDRDNGFEPLAGSALKVTIAKGVHQGLNRHVKFRELSGGEPDEAYFRYYLRFGDNWNPAKDGGKLPGFSGTYGRGGWGTRKSDGVNGWSARGAFYVQPDQASAYSQLRGVGSYVYYAGMEEQSGAAWGWGLGPTGLLEKNRWYSIEQHVKLNAPGRADGRLRAWIDGRLVFDRGGIDFRHVPELKIESVWMNVYHGGTVVAPADLSLYIDNLVVARRYIGPAVFRR
ncbi:polysaccharide lyase [Aromatoleum sp.]|uniref:polysaccharide lyase n=1 Tax=Aromatoleum sp. TaxID=2307007 RepID=UPI00391750AE